MSEYKKVKIGDFLEQYRNTIWIDDSVEYGQITISSKDGVKFRCLKIGKEIGRKRQFVIDLKSHPNTVIFTRQGIADGSIGIAPSNVNGCIATENMPMFSVNENIILVEYLEHLLISPVFKELVATITPSGSAQKSIHERDLLQLEITIPDLETQKEIVKKVSINLKNVETLTKEIESQKAYAKQLRQNILQDAIEGKLTAEWRKTHPVIKGNPDFDAEALFEEIQKEKKSDKKQKELAPIGDDEKPFEIPEGWKWVRLGEIIETVNSGPFGTMIHKSDYSNDGIPLINPTNIKNNEISDYNIAKVNHRKYETMKAYMLKENHIVLARRGDLSKSAIITNKEENWLCGTGCFFIKLKKCYERYFITVYTCSFFQIFLMKDSIGQTMPNLNQKLLINAPFPLPPYEEQKKIVNIIETLRLEIEQLEQQITQREEYANQLMQSILKDAFIIK